MLTYLKPPHKAFVGTPEVLKFGEQTKRDGCPIETSHELGKDAPFAGASCLGLGGWCHADPRCWVGIDLGVYLNNDAGLDLMS